MTTSESAPVISATSPDASAVTAPARPKPARKSILIRLKHGLLRVIDLSALGFLEPIVRLCYGEEPRVQLKKIGQFVVIPVLAFAAFVGVWAFLAPKHKTKSGEVPTPAVVYGAYQAIMTFHERENAKEDAYVTSGGAREVLLADTKARLTLLEQDEAAAAEALAAARATEAAEKARSIAPLQERLDALKAESDAIEREREAKLDAQAAAVTDAASRKAYLVDLAAFRVWKDAERDRQRAVKDDIDAINRTVAPATQEAIRAQTAIAEERQYIGKLEELLGDKGRELKVADLKTKLGDLDAAYLSATGKDLYKTANSLLITQGRLDSLEASTYAKPATLPYQIQRSVLCVFVGFLIGSLIAIPLGILCGLSKTFMAAMTPFIALFKPVSPIVWLPIALIVIGGFIPDPDTHWLMRWLADLPLIGIYQINPAFIASAVTVALCSLWATMVNTALGVASVDKDHLNVARVLRLGFWQRLFKIVLPSALPLVFAGLRISLGVGWMVLIAAELLSSSEGIGKFVWDQFSNGASDSFAKMMVVVFVVGFIGLILDRIMIIFQRMVSFEGSVAAM